MSKKISNHGGARPGAGRPAGSGKYKEPTKAIRVPEGSIRYIKEFLESYPDVTELGTASNKLGTASNKLGTASNKLGTASNKLGTAKTKKTGPNDNPEVYDNVVRLKIPLFSSTVAAGYPSPAEDHVEDTLDLNEYMVQRPDSTFMLRVEGESMKNAGIMPNDILVVDRSLKAAHMKIVIAAIDGELTVKRLYHRGGLVKLLPENPAYPEIELESESDLVIWGVVIGSFRRFQSF